MAGTVMVEVHMYGEPLHRLLVRVRPGYRMMLTYYLIENYGITGWAMWEEITEDMAIEISGREGWKVKQVDLTSNKEASVFAIHGADPEVQAYAMAKYSRSALSMADSIKEISSQKAEKFLNTFYFQYGHKSIADLAHIPMAIENISLLAAIDVVDEQRWDGQERSTRYQDFTKREYYIPDDLDETETAHYHTTMNMLFDAYDVVLKEAEQHFTLNHPRPEGIDDATYRRTIKARAFDIARYLLPMSTLTSVGQINSARSLESQVSRLAASKYEEVVEISQKIKEAATVKPMFRPGSGDALQFGTGCEMPPMVRRYADAQFEKETREIFAAPTLLKYAEPNFYKVETAGFARKLLQMTGLCKFEPEEPTELVTMIKLDAWQSEIEMVTTFLYEQSNLPFRRILDCVRNIGKDLLVDAVSGLMRTRGAHDELLRPVRASGGIIFDINMDIGGMRDMHRHRRANQTLQPFTTSLGFVMPEPDVNSTIDDLYSEATRKIEHAHDIMLQLRQMRGVNESVADYLLPLGTRCRFLMKMDIAEMAYISELRTGPAGHISYRNVAWEIYKHLEAIAPTVAQEIRSRVTDPSEPLDFFKR